MSTKTMMILLALLIPTTHVLLGTLSLVWSEVHRRVSWIGIQFVAVAVLNGLLWLILFNVQIVRFVVLLLDELVPVDQLVTGLVFLQFICYLFIMKNLFRVFSDIRRSREEAAEFPDQFPLQKDDSSFEQPRDEVSRGIRQ